MAASAYELDNLADLLRDFGAEGWTPDRAAEAFDVVARRSFQLESLLEAHAWAVHETTILKGQLPLAAALERLAKSAHRILFGDVLHTAGEYRRGSDPNGGIVYFGGQRGQTVQPLFWGTSPAELPSALDAAFGRLVDERLNHDGDDDELRTRARLAATDAAVCFYKDWSGVHPFYDGNGRVGRYVVMVYLLLHARYVRWEGLDRRETQFLKRINASLKRRGHVDPQVRARYEGFLVQFWRPFVDDVPDQEELDPNEIEPLADEPA